MDVHQIKESKASRAFRLFLQERGKADGLAEGLAMGKADGLAEGETNGKREALFAVLAARNLTPNAAERERLAALTDLDVLDRCLRAAATCTSLDTTLKLLPAPLRSLAPHLSKEQIDALLDPRAPELALLAVSAGCRDSGSEARRVAKRALELTPFLRPELQEAHAHAILAMLNNPLLDYLKEAFTDANRFETAWVSHPLYHVFEKPSKADGLVEGLARGKTEGLAEGLAKGKREALFTVLAARGLTPSPADRERLSALTDLDVLHQCLVAAATCTAFNAVRRLLPARARRA